MLCSVSSAGKSSSKWLDRLRSSKGFPSGDELNLEEFLTHQNPNLTEPKAASADDSRPNQLENQQVQSSEAQNQQESKQLFNIMSNVLAELFVFGESSNIQAKKSSRKQLNPRYCTNDSNRVENASRKGGRASSPMSDDNSRAEVRELSDQVKEDEDKKDLSGGEEEDEGKRELSISGFSRTEVTVIDTSCESWKFEKLLFRKKNVWKVREKKGKTPNFGKKKKRKANTGGVSEDVTGNEKKQKVLDGQCGSTKEGNVGESGLPLSSEEAYHQNERSEEGSRRTLNNVSEVPKKKHVDLKLKRGSSSVILIKNIPTSKKNGANTSRSCMKPVPRRQKA